ncbi:hypothetical protein SDC9_89837 [bioreactor metagenome]|uniref:Uncharacterized protein n=1 Tax=bioreactor metagenome TaxID=1076179 RepID=A0A645A017_9ZZZZ
MPSGSYKLSNNNDFGPRVPKPDLKACLIWFLVFIVVVLAIMAYAIWFEK